ncbi:GNAT family N-acetyltransferase [Azospirillum sp. sgz302134]
MLGRVDRGPYADDRRATTAAQSRSHDVRVVAVDDFDGLTPHRPAWDDLAWNAPQRIPTLLPGWVEAHLRHCLTPEERWFCAFAYAGERLVGVMPVVAAPHRFLGPAFPVLQTPCGEHTPSGDILLAPDQAAVAFRALLAHIHGRIPRHLGIALKHVPERSPLRDALRQTFDGYSLCPGSTAKGSIIRLPDSPTSRTVTLSKNLRRNLKRARKNLETRGAVSVEIRSGPSVLPDFLPEFLVLEASGWKGKMGTAIASSERTTAFYRALVENFCAQGRFEWHILRVDDRPVAVGMGLRCGASLMLPKIGYDEGYEDGDPGNILTEEVIQSAIARPDILDINHMSDQGWHRLWHMDQDDYADAFLVRKAALPFLLEFLPRRLKQAKRSFRDRAPVDQG